MRFFKRLYATILYKRTFKLVSCQLEAISNIYEKNVKRKQEIMELLKQDV